MNGEIFVFGGVNSSNNRKKQVSINQSLILIWFFYSGVENNWLWIETGRGSWLWICLRSLWHIQLPWSTYLALFFECKEDWLWKVYLFLRDYFDITRFSYDGFLFHNQANAKNGHYKTSLAKIDEAPLAVGGESSNTNKAEILDISSNTWTEITEYPYRD